MNRFVAALPRQKIIAPKKELYLPSRRLLCDPARENARCRLFMEDEEVNPRLHPWARIKQYRGPFRIVYPTTATATIALVSGQVQSGSASSSSGSLVLPNNPTTGNFVVVAVWSYTSGSGVAVADANSNSYSKATSTLTCQSAVGGYLTIFYLANAPSNASKTINITSAGTAYAGWAAEFSGVATTSPVDTSATWTSTTTSTNISQPTISSPAGAGELFIGIVANGGSTTITSVNSPWTVIKSIASNSYSAAGYYINSSNSSTSFSATQTGTDEWAGLMAAFKPADSFALDGQSLIFM